VRWGSRKSYRECERLNATVLGTRERSPFHAALGPGSIAMWIHTTNGGRGGGGGKGRGKAEGKNEI
jgi:hypothetical protein